MTPTRKMKREALEEAQQYRSHQSNLQGDEIAEEKLTQLQAFIGHLSSTPYGRQELQLRSDRFGDCKRNEGETSGQFYARLRHWLDRT